MAEGATVANAFVQIMPSAQGATDAIAKAVVPDAQAAGDKAGAALGGGIKDKALSLFGGLGGKLLAGLSVAAVAKGLMDIGSEFDEMTDNIIVGTGASGEALDALCDSAKAIATTVPVSFADAGDIVQDLNTRMGMVGDDLEETGSRVAALGQIMGESVDLSKLTGSLNAFGVSNEEAAEKMDYLWGVSQATGMGFNELTGIIEAQAPVMQELGFSYEETANMAGLLDKAGMDSSGTMAKMSKALVNLAEPGQSAADAFNGVIGKMQGYIEAGDTASALDVAGKVFGTKGAAQFVGALQSGAFSLEEISDRALGASGDIMGTMEATADWPEKWELVKNKAKEALEPLGGALMEAAGQGLDALMGAVDALGGFLEENQPAVEAFGDLVGDVFGFVLETVGSVVGSVGSFLAELGEIFFGASDAAGVSCDDVVAAFQAAGDVVGSVFGAVSAVVSSTLGGLAEVVGGFVGLVGALFTGDLDAAGQAVGRIFGGIQDTVGGVMGAVGDVVSNIVDKVASALGFSGVGDKVRSVFDGVRRFISDPLGTARDFVSGVVDKVKSFLGFSGLTNTVKGVFDTAKRFITDPINAARDAVKGAIDKILGFFNVKISWPKIPLPHFGIRPEGWHIGMLLEGSIPSLAIDWYAKGGVVDGAQLVGVGEAGPEAIVPLSEPNVQPFARAVAERVNDVPADTGAQAVELLRRILGAMPETLSAMQLRRVIKEATA